MQLRAKIVYRVILYGRRRVFRLRHGPLELRGPAALPLSFRHGPDRVRAESAASRDSEHASVSYVFVVPSMVEFSYPETAVVACLAMARSRYGGPAAVRGCLQVGFNFATMNIAVSVAYGVYHVLSVERSDTADPRCGGRHLLLPY